MEDIFLAGSQSCQDPGSCHTCLPGCFPDPEGEQRTCCIHGIGSDQKVSVVKECDAGHLYNEDVDELNGQHEHQLPDAADLQEHGAGQQAEQHAVGEVLQRERGPCQIPALPLPFLAPPSPDPGVGLGVGGRAWFGNVPADGSQPGNERKCQEAAGDGLQVEVDLEGDSGPGHIAPRSG